MANAYEFSRRAVDRFTRAWLSVVERDRSNPCIVTWVPINESCGRQRTRPQPGAAGHASARSQHLTMGARPTRPVISNEGWDTVRLGHSGHPRLHPARSQLTDRFGSAEAIAATLDSFKPTASATPRRGRSRPAVMLTEFGGISFHPAAGDN